MYKLTILFHRPADLTQFEYDWAHKFVPFAERMPGVVRIAVSTIDGGPDGGSEFHKIHDFYFESREAMDAAMLSERGTQAGLRLNGIAKGLFTIVFAEVQEDILRPTGQPPEVPAPQPDSQA